jgi:RNA polymerase sigma-70 factor (ECF subfamily)
MVSKTRFEELVMPLRNAAFKLAYWIVQSRDGAEDVVQDAYLRAYRAFPSFKGNAVRPWLLIIVRNVAYEVLESRKRTRNVMLLSEDFKARYGGENLEVASTDPSPEMSTIANEERQRLMLALAELPPVYRDVVVLRELDGLSYAEIAEVTGAAIGTVMSRLSRGRAELRKVLVRRIAKDEPDGL